MTTEKTVLAVITPADLAMEESIAQPAQRVLVGTSLCIRALRQNWRQGTVACKDRSEVAFSNIKPWRQKGTGRARAGTRRSPLWRKGGIIFGPQKRVRTLKVSKKLKNSALNVLLQKYLVTQRIIAFDWLLEGNPKTSFAFNVLKLGGLHKHKVNLFVDIHDVQVQASFANLPNVRLMFFDQCNIYDMADSKYWLFLKKDIQLFKDMVHKWI